MVIVWPRAVNVPGQVADHHAILDWETHNANPAVAHSEESSIDWPCLGSTRCEQVFLLLSVATRDRSLIDQPA